MRQIARDLGVDRETVARVEAAHFQLPPDATIQEQAKLLIPKGLDVIDKALDEASPVELGQRATIAMRYLENTLFKDQGKASVTFNDARLNVAIGMLPDARPPLTVGDAHARALPNPEVTSDTPNPASASVAQVGIEAAEKDGRATDTIASHPNFFGFSDVPTCPRHPSANIRRALEVHPFEQVSLSAYVADGLICTECEKDGA